MLNKMGTFHRDNGISFPIPILDSGTIKHFQEYTKIADIDSMNFYALEKYFLFLFKKLGFKVNKQKEQGGRKDDFYISRDERNYIVEIKKNISNINLKNVYKQLEYYSKQGEKVILITNADIARRDVNAWPQGSIILIDRSSLKGILKDNYYFNNLV